MDNQIQQLRDQTRAMHGVAKKLGHECCPQTSLLQLLRDWQAAYDAREADLTAAYMVGFERGKDNTGVQAHE